MTDWLAETGRFAKQRKKKKAGRQRVTKLAEREREIQAGRSADRQAARQADISLGKQTDRQPGKWGPFARQQDKQRQADTQIHRLATG